MTTTPTPLRYTLRFRDYWLFHCLSQLCSPITQVALLLCAAAFGHWAWAEGGGVGGALAAAAAAYAAFWLLQCSFNAIYLKSRNNRAVLAAHTVTLSPDGLRDSTDAYDCLYRWHGVGRVVDYGVVVAVYTSGVDAVVVPRTAFANGEYRDAWLQRARHSIAVR
jgi:hypothetical protein